MKMIIAADIKRMCSIVPLPNEQRCHIEIGNGPRIEMVYDRVRGAASGYVWFFICPATGIRCRTLLLVDGCYVHRTAIKNYYRKIQPAWHTGTALDKLLSTKQKQIQAERLMGRKYFKTNYAGKPTKLYLRCIAEIEAAEGISMNGIINGDYDYLSRMPVIRKR